MIRLLALGAVLLLAACRTSDLHPDSLATAGVSKADSAIPLAPVGRRQIDPILFFTLPGGPRILMFSTYQGPWEDNGYAILDLASGRPLAR